MQGDIVMQTYLIRRRGIAADAAELDATLTRLRAFEEQPQSLPARWLRSYALREADGRFGLACLFQSDHVHTLERHAELTQVMAQEILPVTATVPVRPLVFTMVYLIRRRNGWKTAVDLDKSGVLSGRVGDEQSQRKVSWLRSYAVQEHDGTLGTVCLYQAISPEALREQAARVGMPADEITPVIGRIVYRDEAKVQPAPAAAVPA